MPSRIKGLKPEERIEIAKEQLVSANNIFHSAEIEPQFWKDFYLGRQSAQWSDIAPEGTVKAVIPITSIMLDQHVGLFTNRPPKINLKSPSASPFDRVKAQIGEDLVRTVLYDSSFPSLFQEATATFAQLSEAYLYLRWDTMDKRRSPKGTAKLMVLSPSTTRIVHGDGYHFHPTAFIYWERLTPDEIRYRYPKMDKEDMGVYPDFTQLEDDKGNKVMTDADWDWVRTLNLSLVNDGKVTVFTYVDSEVYTSFTSMGVELDYGEHDFGFVPIRQLKQVIVPDSVGSIPLLFHVDGVQKQLNLLFSAALELAFDLAYPPLLEYNNALGSQKITKYRRKKIKVRRSDKGEALSYLTPASNPAVLMEQIRQLIDLTYILVQMPPVALGMARSQITSGFQAQVFQQPATVKEMSWGVQWTVALQDMVSKIIKLIQKKNPEALTVEMENGEKVLLEGIENYEVWVDYAEVTPIDEVRKTQMMILRLQQNLTSIAQALEELGDDNPLDTIEMIKQEGKDVELSPQKVMQVAQAKAAIQQLIQQSMQGIQQMGGSMEVSPEQAQNLPPEVLAQMGQAGAPIAEAAGGMNATNMTRALGEPGAGEERVVPPGGRERVPSSSTVAGGGMPPLPLG